MIVVDCSVVVDALSGVAGSEDIREELLADGDLHAPSLLDYEVVSAVRGLTLGGHLGDGRGHDVLADYDALPLTTWPSASQLRSRSYALRANVSAYDAAYVALAEALECPLLTRDARLARSHGHDVAILVR